MHSTLFKELSKRAVPTKVPDVQFHGNILATKHRFHLCHLQQQKNEKDTTSKPRSGPFGKERKRVYDLINNSFIYTTDEDKEAITHSFNFGEAFYIIGFGNQP